MDLRMARPGSYTPEQIEAEYQVALSGQYSEPINMIDTYSKSLDRRCEEFKKKQDAMVDAFIEKQKLKIDLMFWKVMAILALGVVIIQSVVMAMESHK